MLRYEFYRELFGEALPIRSTFPQISLRERRVRQVGELALPCGDEDGNDFESYLALNKENHGARRPRGDCLVRGKPLAREKGSLTSESLYGVLELHVTKGPWGTNFSALSLFP